MLQRDEACFSCKGMHNRLSERYKILDELSRSNIKCVEGRGGLVVRSRLWGLRVPDKKPDSTEDPSCMWLVDSKSYVVVKRPPVGMAWKFAEGMPTQVSPSSSDRA
ncbi:hypothetical protein AVEN_183394-1, partial [Araneus ventricosus]